MQIEIYKLFRFEFVSSHFTLNRNFPFEILSNKPNALQQYICQSYDKNIKYVQTVFSISSFAMSLSSIHRILLILPGSPGKKLLVVIFDAFSQYIVTHAYGHSKHVAHQHCWFNRHSNEKEKNNRIEDKNSGAQRNENIGKNRNGIVRYRWRVAKQNGEEKQERTEQIA